jgi:flagellar biosynthesis chaperone FliJ
MAKLHGLIKYRRHTLDEKRRILSDLKTELETLENYKARLLSDLEREKNLAAVDLESARHFPLFLKKVKNQISDLDEMIAFKASEIQAATLVVQEAYLEVKKLEITQERSDQVETDRLNRLESIDLDEMGLEAFRRHKETDQ